MNADALKLRLIDKIMSLQDFQLLKKVENSLTQSSIIDENIKRLNKPMRKKTNVEDLKKEQNFKPVDKKDFFKKIEALNIEEPIEDLLKMI